jgi:hypothetical protein
MGSGVLLNRAGVLVVVALVLLSPLVYDLAATFGS